MNSIQIQVKQPISSSRQNGAALITSLVILLILTVLGITGMGTTSMEERMTGNMRDQLISFQAAEAGLSDGERHVNTWLVGASPIPDSSGTNGVYTIDSLLAPTTAYDDYADGAFADAVIWNNATAYGATTGVAAVAEVATPPLYILEHIQTIAQTASADDARHPTGNSFAFYRVTTRGSGLSPNAITLLQSTIAHRY